MGIAGTAFLSGSGSVSARPRVRRISPHMACQSSSAALLHTCPTACLPAQERRNELAQAAAASLAAEFTEGGTRERWAACWIVCYC